MQRLESSISLATDVRDRLRLHGGPGETYNDVLQRLLDNMDRTLFLEKARRAAQEPREPGWIDLDEL